MKSYSSIFIRMNWILPRYEHTIQKINVFLPSIYKMVFLRIKRLGSWEFQFPKA